MSATTRRVLGVSGCAALVLAGVLAAAPAASAQPPARHVRMPFPTGGEHTVRFGALTFCSRADGESRYGQALSANAVDLDSYPMAGFADFSATLFPFNSATVEWTHKASGRTGRQTVQTVGYEVGVQTIPTAVGDLAVTITVTRSALPTLAPGSALPGPSVTHTETLDVPGIDTTTCRY